ncbi:hypothetical protein J7E97_09995 [Streptomyces sp. ISL-66]|uniref:hypothetical protein n=1 Tax=Streptomyces sp. ISL-66 TaxID=2819186 RepID=UPI001BE69BCD|nr:hypothetical protein [Streptomyces sp. ISL-66]MBT2468198.1 hypothetical protein [Streptomyces sp. ISL-66]
MGPYEVREVELLKEALAAVQARPEIAEQLKALQEPPELEPVVEEQRAVIKMNLEEHLERTRRLGSQLDEYLVREIANSGRGRLARFRELSEAAEGLRDVADALAEISREPDPVLEGREYADRVRDLLTAAWTRRVQAAELRDTPGGSARTGRKHRADPPDWPGPSRTAVTREYIAVHGELIQIEGLLKQDMGAQRAQASEQQEFRTLEAEWEAARTELRSMAESAVHGVVLTALNSAVAADFALSMQVRSLDGLRETLANRKIVITSSFERLESMIDRHGEGSFGIAGPRGVGKSTLIKSFTTSGGGGDSPAELPLDVPERVRLGVAVAAPVAYEARDFVLHLHAEVCLALLGPDADRDLEGYGTTGPRPSTKAAAALALALAGVAVLAAGTTLVARAARLVSAPDDWWSYAGLALTLTAAVLLVQFLIFVVRLAVPVDLWPASDASLAQALVLAQSRRYSVASLLAGTWCPVLAVCAAVGLALLTVSGGVGRGTWMLLGGAAVIVLGVTLLLTGSRMARNAHDLWVSSRVGPAETPTYSGEAVLRERALRQLRQIRYEQTLSNEHSMTLRLGGAKQLPVGFDVGSKQGTSLAERAKTYPEIVSGLRAFLEAVTQQYQLIIAVDELDKLRSAADVENFLNDIKGVFGASRCYFLVSVSEEAAGSFERRGMPFRDVFDSCFDDVLMLQRLQLPAARDILYGLLLGWTKPFVALCYVLSGGLPRELQRSARALVGPHKEMSWIHLVGAVPELMRREATARLGAVRHGLLREACGPAGLALVNHIERIDPAGASTDQFREWYEELASWCLRQFAGVRTPDGSSPMPTATRMGCELAAFMLFAATVMEFFGSTLDANRLQQAERPDAGGRSLTKLVDARHALSLSPWTSVGCLTTFRRAWSL